MTDINSREDIERLVTLFYKSATKHPDIKHFFTEVVQLNFEKHIPVICDFWESVLFKKVVFKGNPMVKHIVLNRKSPMIDLHFKTWLSLWQFSVDDLFIGTLAEEAKYKATSIAALMQHKIKSDLF